jgi:3'-phosphoadenosine 5'-phosphosulfate sulfotransferase
MSKVKKVTPEKKAKFLSVLAEGGSVTLAARAISVARKNVYAWRNKDEQFKADWEDAVEEGTDVLEDAAVRRAMDHSDTLLIFLLKGRRNREIRGETGTYRQGWWSYHAAAVFRRAFREDPRTA